MANPLLQFVESVCVQTAVYWGNPRSDGLGGTEYDAPVEVKCRWDDTTNVVTDSKGAEVVSSATLLVTQDLDVDGFVMLGSLADVEIDDSSGGEDYLSPQEVVGAHRIIRADKNPLFRSTDEFVRQVYL